MKRLRPIPRDLGFTPDEYPSHATIAGPASDPEDYRAYAAVTFDSRDMTLAGDGTRKTRTVQAKGDHLYIAEVSGYNPIYARVGPDTNPFVRLEAGMTIRRPFYRVTFGVGDVRNEALGNRAVFSRALCYASVGPLIDPPPRSYGFSQPFFASGTATTTPIELFTSGALVSGNMTVGKRGGCVTLLNMDLVNTLWLVYMGGLVATPMDPRNIGAFPIVGGQAYSFPLDGSVSQRFAEDSGGAYYIGTESGSCDYAVIGSRLEMDLFEGAEQFSPLGIG